MPERIRIKVTRADIDSGIGLSAEPIEWVALECPVALAATRAFGKRMIVVESDGEADHRIGPMLIKPYQRHFLRGVGYAVPSDVIQKIMRFDEGGGMEPFAFEVQGD